MDDEETEEEVINRIKSEIADIYESDSLKIQVLDSLVFIVRVKFFKDFCLHKINLLLHLINLHLMNL